MQSFLQSSAPRINTPGRWVSRIRQPFRVFGLDAATAIIFSAVVIYVVLSISGGHTSLPWCDEGWFANPAYNLLKHGKMATTVIDPTSTYRQVKLDGIDQHTYWIMPLSPLLQALWYRLVGFGIFSMRALSTVFGLLLLGAWYSIAKTLSKDQAVAVVTTAFMAVDFDVVRAASVGRMDMISAAFGAAAVAVYLHYRIKHLHVALFLSNALAAAAILTHPYGILFFVDLCFLALFLDSGKIRIRSVALAAAPYLLAIACWGSYIAQDPASFQLQFLGNAGTTSDRYLFFSSKWSSLKDEIVQRYLLHYGVPLFSLGPGILKVLILAAYVLGWMGVLFSRELRARQGSFVLLLLGMIHFVLLCILDGFKMPFYLIYTVPFFIATLAVVLVHAWRKQLMPRSKLVIIAVVLVALHVATTVSRIARNPYQHSFLSAARFLSTHVNKDALLMASSEMGFQWGFDSRLVDDYRLGYRSGKRPDVIVIDSARYRPWISQLEQQDPQNYLYIQELLSSYTLLYDHSGYRIYRRNQTALPKN